MGILLVICLICMVIGIGVSYRLGQCLLVLLKRETCPVKVVGLVSWFWSESHLAACMSNIYLNNYKKIYYYKLYWKSRFIIPWHLPIFHTSFYIILHILVDLNHLGSSRLVIGKAACHHGIKSWSYLTLFISVRRMSFIPRWAWPLVVLVHLIVRISIILVMFIMSPTMLSF